MLTNTELAQASSSMLQNSQSAEKQAAELFRAAYWHALAHKVWAWLTGRRFTLAQLDEATCCTSVQSSVYGGVQTVDLKKIKGSENRATDFDQEFNPLRPATYFRWLSIARECLRDHPMPPVELVELNGTYFVRDGHHRISVARSLGQEFIEAEVTRMKLRVL